MADDESDYERRKKEREQRRKEREDEKKKLEEEITAREEANAKRRAERRANREASSPSPSPLQSPRDPIDESPRSELKPIEIPVNASSSSSETTPRSALANSRSPSTGSNGRTVSFSLAQSAEILTQIRGEREEELKREKEVEERKAREEKRAKELADIEAESANREAERKAKREERRAREAEEEKIREQESKAREDARRKMIEDAERKAQQEIEEADKAKAEQEAKAEQDRKAREAIEAKEREEAHRKKEEDKAKAEAERKAKEDEERAIKERQDRQEQERKAKRDEEAAMLKQAEEIRKEKEAADKAQRDKDLLEKQAQAKAEEEAKVKAKAEQEAKAKAKAEEEAKAKAKAEQEAKAKAEEEAKAKAEQEAQAKAKAEEQAKVEEAKAKAKAEEEVRAKAKAKAEQEIQAKAKAEEEAKAKANAEKEAKAKAKAEEEAKEKDSHSTLQVPTIVIEDHGSLSKSQEIPTSSTSTSHRDKLPRRKQFFSKFDATKKQKEIQLAKEEESRPAKEPQVKSAIPVLNRGRATSMPMPYALPGAMALPGMASGIALPGMGSRGAIPLAGLDGMVAAKSIGHTIDYSQLGNRMGIEVFRVASEGSGYELFLIPKSSHGRFRINECAIVVSTLVQAEKSSFIHQIFFWIGRDSSETLRTQGKQKAEEVAKKLWETYGKDTSTYSVKDVNQEKEPSEFRELFKNGMLSYVEPSKLKSQVGNRNDIKDIKMYRLGGKKNIYVEEVEISWKSLNRTDVFILDDEDTIYQWNGKFANRMKITKALDLTVRLRDERMVKLKAELVVIDKREEVIPQQFQDRLGDWGGEVTREVSAHEETQEEEAFWAQCEFYTMKEDPDEANSTPSALLRSSGSLGVELRQSVGKTSDIEGVENVIVGKIPDSQSLYSKRCHVIKYCWAVWIWYGKFSNQKCRAAAMKLGRDLAGKLREGLVPQVQHQECENALFRANVNGTFREYIDTPEKFERRRSRVVSGRGVVENLRQKKVNIHKMHYPEKYQIILREEIILRIPSPLDDVTDENQTVKIWVLDGTQRVEIPNSEFGKFYKKNCYIIQYSQRNNPNSEWRHVIYFYQGTESLVDERTASALIAKDFSAEFRDAMQIRVVMLKESPQFLATFKNLILKNGDFLKRKVKKLYESKSPDDDVVIGYDWQLYQIRDQLKIAENSGAKVSDFKDYVDLKAVQVELPVKALNARDTFVLVSDLEKRAIILRPKEGMKFHEDFARSLIGAVCKTNVSIETINFSENHDTFWKILEIDWIPNLSEILPSNELFLKFFQVGESSGVFDAQQLFNLNQVELEENNGDAFIVDAQSEVFLWMGKNLSDRKMLLARQLVEEYVLFADDRVGKSIPIIFVTQSMEPSEFAYYFFGWNFRENSPPTFSSVLKTNVVSKGNSAENAGPSTPPGSPGSESPISSPTALKRVVSPLAAQVDYGEEPEPGKVYFAYDRLIEKPLPPDVDNLIIETYLSPKEFYEIFGMTKMEFTKVPQWKKTTLKKDKKLF